MSLNQIIDQNPAVPLVCDTTLNLKANSLRIENTLEFSSSGGSIFSTTYVLTYNIGGTLYSVSGGGSLTGPLVLQQIGNQVICRIPAFYVSASSGPSVNGIINIALNNPIPASFTPHSVYGSLFQTFNSNVLQNTPGYLTYNSNSNFSLYAGASGTSYTTGQSSIPSSSNIGPGSHDIILSWLTI